jgi:hypothetical protein
MPQPRLEVPRLDSFHELQIRYVRGLVPSRIASALLPSLLHLSRHCGIREQRIGRRAHARPRAWLLISSSSLLYVSNSARHLGALFSSWPHNY